LDNHDTEVERAHFDLHPGCEAKPFAAVPMLANPVHVVWNSRGRLWVACSWAFPIRPPVDAPRPIPSGTTSVRLIRLFPVDVQTIPPGVAIYQAHWGG